jgi:K+-sensing histidine kinase KdpD
MARLLRPWALMLLMLAAATVLRGLLDPLLGDRAPFVTYYPLTVFLALFAGAWPAAVSVVLSVILSALLFPPTGSIRGDLAALAIYVPANAALIVLIERVRRAGAAARRRENAARASATVGRRRSAQLESRNWRCRMGRTPASDVRVQPRRARDA